MGRSGSGVEVRDSSIRIKFVLEGIPYKERLTLNGKSLLPTPANIKHATRLSEQIKTKIAAGVFTFSEFFPDSPRAAKSKESNSFGKLADLWLESKGKLAEATYDQYATAVRFWKNLFGADKTIDDLTHKYLVAKIGSYPWSSAKSHNNYLIALRGIMNLEYRGSTSLNNPMTGIENMPVVKKLPDPFTDDERHVILSDMKVRYDERVYAYFTFMFYTGMRPEEAIALRWSDVDFKQEKIRVQRVRTFKGSEREGSKTHTERDVDLLPQAIEALSIMKPHTFMLKVDRENDTAHDIFMNPVTNKPWHDERSQRDTYWRPSLKRLGIRWRKPYNTRHTFATCALMAGIPPAYIADQLGHSVQMLLTRYARWIKDGDKGSAKAMMKMLLGNGNSSQISPNENKISQ